MQQWLQDILSGVFGLGLSAFLLLLIHLTDFTLSLWFFLGAIALFLLFDAGLFLFAWFTGSTPKQIERIVAIFYLSTLAFTIAGVLLIFHFRVSMIRAFLYGIADPSLIQKVSSYLQYGIRPLTDLAALLIVLVLIVFNSSTFFVVSAFV